MRSIMVKIRLLPYLFFIYDPESKNSFVDLNRPLSFSQFHLHTLFINQSPKFRVEISHPQLPPAFLPLFHKYLSM